MHINDTYPLLQVKTVTTSCNIADAGKAEFNCRYFL